MRKLNFNNMKMQLFLFALIIAITGACQAQSHPLLVNGKYVTQTGELFTGTARLDAQQTDGVTTQEIEVLAGQLHGSVRYINQNGTLAELGHYSNGEKNGQWLQYSPGGQLIGEAYYKNGLKDGIWTVWDEAGIKRYHMVYSSGKKVDTWKMWDEQANLVSERIYKD
jgi:antitoxin component YwqK of YwqJK toxin-antitoxin module